MSTPRFFATPAKWRAWLEANHDKRAELHVGFHKKASGRAGMTYHEALDAALCFGWIDGVRNRMDEASYRIRFTPRRKGSYWSAVNIARVAALIEGGAMHAAGLAAFEKRDRTIPARYSGEQRTIAFDEAYERRFRANAKAWAFFMGMPASYRKPATWWVMSAKREETRQRRLATLITDSAAGRKVPPLTPAEEKRKRRPFGVPSG